MTLYDRLHCAQQLNSPNVLQLYTNDTKKGELANAATVAVHYTCNKMTAPLKNVYCHSSSIQSCDQYTKCTRDWAQTFHIRL